MYEATPAGHMAYRFEDNAAWSLARARLLGRFANGSTPAILDVGCHTGAFLAGLPATWRRYGIESAHEPREVASAEHGVGLIGERLETVSPEWAHRFDAVTMFDVVEHLPDPEAGIAHAARLLKPGGVLMLSSADLDAWTWRWLGSSHWYLQTPQHLSVISRRFLQHVAQRHALELESVQTIPHRHAPRRERWREALKAVYWGLRCRRGLFRIPHRLLQSFPGLQDLRHMQSVPWTMTLADHTLGVYEL
jgi:SAM-dependent methyltransferase